MPEDEIAASDFCTYSNRWTIFMLWEHPAGCPDYARCEPFRCDYCERRPLTKYAKSKLRRIRKVGDHA